MRVSYGIFTVPNKSFELRRCSNYWKSNYKESTAFITVFSIYSQLVFYFVNIMLHEAF